MRMQKILIFHSLDSAVIDFLCSNPIFDECTVYKLIFEKNYLKC